MNIDKLKQLYEQSTNKVIDANNMGITTETWRKIAAGSDLRVSTLEKIAQYYNVPIGYFFDEAEADGRTAEQYEIERLKGQIEGMEKAIEKLGMSLPKK